MKLYACGNYDELKSLSKAVKIGDLDAIEAAAKLMASHCKGDEVLIPIPNRYGRACYTLALAIRISKITGCRVENCLQGQVRQSLCDIKKAGGRIFSPVFFKRYQPKKEKWQRYVLVDNVFDTGTTAKAAEYALKKFSDLLVISKV